MTEHAVYPAGPPCQPNCPGPSSMYHDGYADGFERAEAEATAAAEQRLRASVEALVSVRFGGGPALLHRAEVLGLLEPQAALASDPASPSEPAIPLHQGAASPRQGEPVGHQPEAKCRTCGHREHDHHHSAEPRWCGADFEMLGFTACPCPGFAALSEPAEAGEP